MTIRAELAAWHAQVADALALFADALPRDRPWIVSAGRLALRALGNAAPGPDGCELAVARVQVAVAELVVAARDGTDEQVRFALRWVTEAVSALGV